VPLSSYTVQLLGSTQATPFTPQAVRVTALLRTLDFERDAVQLVTQAVFEDLTTMPVTTGLVYTESAPAT
jgi:hypothetical protein